MRDPVRRKKPPKGDAPAWLPSRGLVTGVVSVLLFGLVWIVFGQTLRHEFVNYDDDQYVYGNLQIKNGLTFNGIKWAFTNVHVGNWHPLTSISHMLDCQLYGIKPWGHHLTNILLHAAAAILLFLALRKLTGTHWPSAFVAAMFAIHPLRAESVAWVAERKDVLSGVFFMLILWTYANYVRSHRPPFSGQYAILLALFGLGLMCKPTLVTVPFVLLLLDYWPLERVAPCSTGDQRASRRDKSLSHGGPVTRKSIQDLVIEKIPFFLLSAVSCVATLLAQERAMVPMSHVTFGDRVGNAMVSYVAYLGQMIWPTRLSVLYPYPKHGLDIAQALLAALILLIISVVFFIWRTKYRFLLVGWLWFLGMLVPMIGIVQVGSQARADRYTYLSQIGLYVLVTWGALELFRKWRRGRTVLIAVAVLIGSALTADSYFETRSWRDGEALWNHALSHNPDNYLARANLAEVLMKKGRLDDAIVHLRKVVEINAAYAEAINNLGYALMRKGQLDEAVVLFRKTLEIKPDYPEANFNLAFALGYASEKKGDKVEAINSYRAAIQIKPNDSKARNNLAICLAETGRSEEAVAQFREVLRIDEDYPDAHNNFALLLLQLGQRDEAVVHLREALRLKPGDAEVQARLRQLGVEQ